MKYCVHCGAQLADEAVMCPLCGKMVSPPPNQPQPAQNKEVNVLCIIGFVASFISNIVGLILCIIGYSQTKNTADDTGRALAMAGIIISVIKFALVIFVLFIFCIALVATI